MGVWIDESDISGLTMAVDEWIVGDGAFRMDALES